MYGIVFFGVPNHGMDITSLKPMVRDGPNRALLESIGRNSPFLRRQHDDFQKALGTEGESEVVCFYETAESPTPMQVCAHKPFQASHTDSKQDRSGKWGRGGPLTVLVDIQSATHCRAWEQNVYPISRTHSDMVKFEPHDNEYDKAIEQIKALVRRAHPSASMWTDTSLD